MRNELEELLQRTDLTENELRAIPARANINNQAVHEFFCRRHGVPLERILAGTTVSAEDFLNEKLWTDPLTAQTLDLNAAEAFPGFFHHTDAVREGRTFVDVLPNLHIIYFQLVPIRSLLGQLQRANAKFNNEYQLEGFHIRTGTAKVRLTPYPYRLGILVGQECSFVRGVLQANFTLHGIRESTVSERYCSTPLRRLVEGVYRQYELSYREADGCAYINDHKVARRIPLDTEVVDGHTVFRPTPAWLGRPNSEPAGSAFESASGRATALLITRTFTVQGHTLFREGEIYDAPHCLFDLTWRPRSPIGAAIEQARTTFGLRRVTRLEMSRHIEHSNRQFFELLEQKQLTIDALQSADRQKDTFLTTTAHDLRTPLNGIMGLLESASTHIDGADPARARRSIELSLTSARRLSHLVNDILDFSRLRDGSMSLSMRYLDIVGVLNTTIETVRPLLGTKTVELSLANDESEGCQVYGDENRLFQVFFNLLGNAVKFTETGYIRVSCRSVDHTAEVVVADTGIGIPPDKLAEVFDTYTQVDPERAQIYGGSGIGLTVVKRIVELHGGTVTAESVEGEGSTFTVRLPLGTARERRGETPGREHEQVPRPPAVPGAQSPTASGDNASPNGSAVRSAEAGAGSGTPERPVIWICDDDAINLEVLESMLGDEGYATRSFTRGEELLAELDRGLAPAAVLLDVMMPGLGGLETCRRIRRRSPLSSLPVVMVTARAFPEDLVSGFDAGASDYIGKPVVRQELLARTRLHVSLAGVFTTQRLHHTRLRLLDTVLALIGMTRGLQSGSDASDESPPGPNEGAAPEPIHVVDRINTLLASVTGGDPGRSGAGDLGEILTALGEEHARLFGELMDLAGTEDAARDFSGILEKLLALLHASSSDSVTVNADRLGLSAREAEVVEQVCLGYGNSEVASKLGIAENTVKRHLYNAFNKLGVDTRTQLIYKTLAVLS